MFAGSSWRPSLSGLALVAGLFILVGVDTIYAVDSANDGWLAGGAYDPLWGLAMLVLAAAAWLPARRGPVIGSTRRTLVFPSAFAAIAVGVLVYGQSVRLNPVAVALAVLALLTVMVRMALLLRETATLAVSRKLSLTDDLTGLANRRAFTAEVERAVADRRPCALLMIDLDQFKELNDTLGHHVGDELLRSVGPRLSATMRPGDVVARLGGDEFGVLIKDADTETATVAATRLRAALGRPYALAGISLHVGASIGIAVFPEHAEDANTLLRHADVAMYEAKRGRTGHGVYASDGDHHSRDRLELAGEMRHALRNDELTLHYQPVADLATGKLVGVEALVRWRHPERGLLAPGAFLPAIEHTELMRELSRRVLAMAICQAGAWFRLDRPWRVAANLSATDLLDRSLVDDVSSLLRRYGTPAAPADARGHRERPHDRPRPRHAGAGRASRAGRAARPRRLRHRLVVADPPAADARPRDQDRPLVRRRDGHRVQLGRDRLLDGRPRPRARPAGRRRGHRGRGDLAAAARRGLRRGPGLPPLAPAARRPSSRPRRREIAERSRVAADAPARRRLTPSGTVRRTFGAVHIVRSSTRGSRGRTMVV